MVRKKILLVFIAFIENYSWCSFMNIFQSKFRFSAAEYPCYIKVVKLAISEDETKASASFTMRHFIIFIILA